MSYLFLSAFLPQFLCQFVADMSMKPDVTFGDHNDRFDISSLVRSVNRNFDRLGRGDDNQDDVGPSRRQGQILINGQLGDFSYRTEPQDDEGVTPEEHKRKVNDFYAKNTQLAKELVDRLHDNIKAMRSSGFPHAYRRSISQLRPDPEEEVLMHYAVPVELTIQGYMQAPLVQ